MLLNFLGVIQNLLKSIFERLQQTYSPEKPNTENSPNVGDDNMRAHHDYVPPRTSKKDEQLLREFKEENRIEEDNWNYRKGAPYTAFFGIANGWGPNMEPGYIRIHPGVDRAAGGTVEHGGKQIHDIVMTPFNFDSTHFIDYKGKGYGTLIFLTSSKYQFDMRIAHMHPQNDIIPWALKQFKAGNPYKQDWLIGSAGTYGYSTGAHTHTELVSHDDSVEIFEILLQQKYGDEAHKEYSPDRIISEYHKREKFKNATEGEIMEHWAKLKKEKRVFFVNDYKYCFFWKDKPYTRYATDKLFNGL